MFNNYLFNGNKVPLFFTEMNSRIFNARAIARHFITVEYVVLFFIY